MAIPPFDDDALRDIQRAGTAHRVPPAFLMAIIVRESSGNWTRDGNRFVDIGRDSGRIMPYVGIFEDAWRRWGCPGEPSASVGNRVAQVSCLARGMRRWYDDPLSKQDWRNVAAIHFSGKPYPNNYTDENGMTTEVYVTSFMKDYARFGGDAGGSLEACRDQCDSDHPGLTGQPQRILCNATCNLKNSATAIGAVAANPARDAINDAFGEFTTFLSGMFPRLIGGGAGIALLTIGLIAVMRSR